MRVLVDMNLSPAWCELLHQHGWQALHWSTVGNPRATDDEIMRWAQENGYVVFTHDLDFGSLLALTGASGPSVIQLRTQAILPAQTGSLLIAALKQFGEVLERGGLVVIDEPRARARVLPLRGPA